MIEKKTIIDQIEITRYGNVQIRFALLVLEDGKEIASTWHRTSVSRGRSLEKQLEAVNVHLEQLGKQQIEADKIPLLRAICDVVHTEGAADKYLETIKAKAKIDE